MNSGMSSGEHCVRWCVCYHLLGEMPATKGTATYYRASGLSFATRVKGETDGMGSLPTHTYAGGVMVILRHQGGRSGLNWR